MVNEALNVRNNEKRLFYYVMGTTSPCDGMKDDTNGVRSTCTAKHIKKKKVVCLFKKIAHDIKINVSIKVLNFGGNGACQFVVGKNQRGQCCQ